ncbi:hypothetical protein PBY51_015405 [Eleginops maclovinus]|uniref:Ig-like domain-containing protein n=1 Tax=Eleginops maclovinus TaxID=56733 RepID=A0AAN7WY88_ELEMC|nr:hypothetical protein PBY51_015405 [Eleginops maclovinus]
MENVLVFCLLFLASLRSASTEDMLFEEGGSVTLNLRPAPSKPITVIEWKFNGITLAEWAKDVVELTYKRANTSLDITTGRLVVQKMTKTDQGEYSVEVNNRVQAEKYQVVFIKRVPKPSVLTQPLSCSTEDEQCSLTCDGDTTEAEPVTYSWKTGAGEWKASGRSMTITKAEHGQVETFTCKMKNPLEQKISLNQRRKKQTAKMDLQMEQKIPLHQRRKKQTAKLDLQMEQKIPLHQRRKKQTAKLDLQRE